MISYEHSLGMAMRSAVGEACGSHRLKSVAIVGGFLDGVRLNLADGLNCVIGGRGTGKTTTLELIRYVMDAQPDRETDSVERKRIESLVEKNLDGGQVELEVETKDGFSYLVSRACGDESIVLTKDRRATDLGVKSGGLFRVDIFSQNAVERLADQTASQLELLDSFEAEQIAEIGGQLARVRSALAANMAQVIPLQTALVAMGDELSRLPGVEEKLRAYSDGGGDNAAELNQAHNLKAMRDREQRAVAAVDGLLGQLRGDTARLRGRLNGKLTALVDREMAVGPNGDVLRELLGEVRRYGQQFENSVAEADGRLEEAQRQLAEHSRELGLAHKEQELAFRVLLERHQHAQGQVAERTRLERLRNELLAKRRQRDDAHQQLTELQAQRRQLLERLSELFDCRFAIREAVAQRITAQLTPAIRVRVVQYGNPEVYQSFLESRLRGGRIRHGVVASKLVSALWPAELARILRQRDLDPLVDRAELNPEQAEKVVAVLGTEETLMELEAVELLDRPQIELRDGQTYKDCAMLSTGQKCTAILPILLLDSDRPLLVDQPEDNLDNRFIFETVVDSIRKIKGRRQLIFVTHNPNIPVLAEAEQVIVLESNGTAAHKANEGSVDQCKEEIVTLLEGGEEAFKRRKTRYAY